MGLSTGTPTWTFPDWRKAPVGLRVEHVLTGEPGTYLGPAKNKHNGARVRWDRAAGMRTEDWAYVVSPARDLRPVRIRAWELIGYDSTADSVYDDLAEKIGPGSTRVRIVGGRSTYEAVLYNDSTARSDNVKLARLEANERGVREVSRYVDAETLLEVIEG